MFLLHEILESKPLLDGNGNLQEPGFAKKLLLTYDRLAITANAYRIKEWDYYLIGNDHYAVALTIADNSYMGIDSLSFLWFDQAKEITVSKMQFLTRGKKNFPNNSVKGDVRSEGKGYQLNFSSDENRRILTFRMEHFNKEETISGELILEQEPEESIVIATPFHKKKYFYYNQKINCMRARGKVMIGETGYIFDSQDSFGVLDWGRGVWTYKNTWYWGSGSGLIGGIPFGFNIGYGFGDASAASENMLFFNGKAHKLSQVTFHIPLNSKGREEYRKPWTFSSDDGRFEMDFQPILDRASCTNLFILKSDQHQVFGKFTGVAILDDGTRIQVKDFMGFAEKVHNKW